MLALTCDGSYPGLLTAIFEAHQIRPQPDRVLLGPPAQQDMLTEYRFVQTQPEKAQRVQRAIDQKLSPNSANHVRNLHASGIPDAGTLLMAYLKLGWQVGPALDHSLLHPAVAPVHLISRKVGGEVHRLAGLARFYKLSNGVYYAPIEPDYCIVPLLAGHFQNRMPGEMWILHDRARNMAAFYKPGELKVVHGIQDAPQMDENDPYLDLWSAFYDAVAIASRKSFARRVKHMPRRYWKYLPEIRRSKKEP